MLYTDAVQSEVMWMCSLVSCSCMAYFEKCLDRKEESFVCL